MHSSVEGSAIKLPFALPPGFCAIDGGPDAWAAALQAAAAGADPGRVLRADGHGRCQAVFILSPDRPLEGCALLLDLGLLALFDALAVLAPPQMPVWIGPGATLVVDGAGVATVRAAAAPAAAGAVPDWAVLGIDIALTADDAATGERPGEQPGAQRGETCLAEEGFGVITPDELVHHVCRHLLLWLDAWQHDGDAALAQAVARREAVAA